MIGKISGYSDKVWTGKSSNREYYSLRASTLSAVQSSVQSRIKKIKEKENKGTGTPARCAR